MSKLTVTIPTDARAVIVGRDGRITAIKGDESVLNLEADLQSHLNEYPFTDEWLVDLRDFVDAKLRARQAARKKDGLSVSLPSGRGFGIVQGFPLICGRVEVAS